MEERMYISEITRIAAVGRDNPVETMEKKGVTSKINDSKLYVPVVTLSINDNIQFQKMCRRGFKRTISWIKYRSETTAQPEKQ